MDIYLEQKKKRIYSLNTIHINKTQKKKKIEFRSKLKYIFFCRKVYPARTINLDTLLTNLY